MKKIFEKTFTKNPSLFMTVTLEYISDAEPKPKGHPEHVDIKKGDRMQVSFNPPYSSLLLEEPTFPLRGKVEKGKPLYKIISVDKIEIYT